MPKGTLAAAYHVRVKARHARFHQKLDQIGAPTGATVDFLDFVCKMLDKSKEEHHDDAAAERISQTERFSVEGRILRGQILVGDYGQVCRVYDRKTKKTVYRKTVDDADQVPFFFRLEVFEGRDEALLLMEKSRKTAPTSAFRSLLKTTFKDAFPELTITVDPVMPTEVYKEYLAKGSVQKISFIRMGLPSDIADLLDGGHEEILGKTEFVVTAAKGKSLGIRKSLFSSNDPMKSIQDLYELKDLDYENIKVDVKLGANRRSVDLGKKHVSPIYELNGVERGSDGNPVYESIAAAFDVLAKDIAGGSYGTA